MNFRKPTSRWALWAFAAALLLKGAMPWLASASAELRGVAVFEVCSVYGTLLVPAGGGLSAPASEHPADHVDAQCALTALRAFAGVQPVVPASVPALPRGVSHVGPPELAPAHDACAAWAARRKHGPPLLA